MNQYPPQENYTPLVQPQPGYGSAQPVYSVLPNQQQAFYQPPQTIVVSQAPVYQPIVNGTTTTSHSKTVCIICSVVFGVLVFFGVIVTIILVSLSNTSNF